MGSNGYLATITSSEENNFITKLIGISTITGKSLERNPS
jgi:hypothetical protein